MIALAYMLAGFFACGSLIAFWQWLVDLDARRDWGVGISETYTLPGVPFIFDHRGYVIGSRKIADGRRANYVPRAGQLWQLSDPARLAAFRIIAVDRANRYPYGGYVYVHWLTPGYRQDIVTIAVERFQTLGPQGYMRIS